MAWNQPNNSQDPWGKRRNSAGPQGFDKALRDWQKRLEALFGQGGRGGGSEGQGQGPVPSIGLPLLIGLLLWLGTGFYQVEPAERGVITRFGRYVETRPPGLGWHLPWPMEKVTKVNIQNVNSVEYESRVLTADINLVDMRLAVQYRLSDPVKVLFRVRDPESTLRSVSESAIREVVGRSELNAILVSNRQAATDMTRDLIQSTLDRYETGITVQTVNLTDVQVPEAVIPSQRDANKALADKERYVKEAEAYASGIIPVAEGNAARQLQDAEAYKARVTAIAEGEASRFSQLLTAYKRAPGVTRDRLYIEAVEAVFERARKVIIDSKGSGNMLYLPLDKILEKQARAPASATASQGESGATETVTVDGRQRGER
ncbi:MAG: FtsH protease activity modulator HflK [Steroidobacteraceae bacterium]